MTEPAVCPASRTRATRAEMSARADFVIDFADRYAPVSVRQIFYAASVAGLIEKTERGYAKNQSQVLKLRRAGRLPQAHIVDMSRRVHQSACFDGVLDALTFAAATYRKDIWSGTGLRVEVWIEKSALAGTLRPLTDDLGVALCPTGGFCSESFAHAAVERLAGKSTVLVVQALYDFDRSGQDAARSLREMVERFGGQYGVPVAFNLLGLTEYQVIARDLPTRPAKRATVADQRWPHSFAAELDALPPDTLREIVRQAIEGVMPAEERERLQKAEQAERAEIRARIGGDHDDD